MRLSFRIIAIVFLECAAATCVERGVFFFSREHVGFSDVQNLWLALATGVAFVVGAFSSHRLAGRLGEKALLALAVALQCLLHIGLVRWAYWPAGLFVGSAAVGLSGGLKWPVIESYVGAGRTPAQTARALGHFNIAWTTSIPVALLLFGPIIKLLPVGIFLLAAAMNLASLWLIRPLPARPVHLPDDHLQRPDPRQLVPLRSLLLASRWLMLAAFSSLCILAPLMPGIFQSLNVDTQGAPALSGLLDAVRVGAFILMQRWVGWHNRAWPLAVTMTALPVSFFMILLGPNLPTVLAGEVVFGAVTGLAYYAALYYAMVVKNASVNACGIHEALLGLALVIGPGSGLLSKALMPLTGNVLAGTLLGIAPLLTVCISRSVRALRGISLLPVPEGHRGEVR